MSVSIKVVVKSMVIIGEYIRKEVIPLIGITEEEITKAMENPIHTEKFEHLGLKLFFCLLNYSDDYFLLAETKIAPRTGDKVLSQVFKLRRSFIEKAQTTNPIVLLEMFIDRFGVEVQIGDFHNKFIIREAVPIPQMRHPNEFTRFLRIKAPKKAKISQSMYVNFQKSGTWIVVQCALVYAINLSDYKNWIQ